MLLAHQRNYGLGMDALMTICFWKTNVIMVLCSGDRMLLEYERLFGLGMDALILLPWML